MVAPVAYYVLEPEVAGELGDGTVLDAGQHPPTVSRLHYEFSGWLGDDLLQSFPCYIVTQRLSDAIAREGLTGCEFGIVHVSTSSQFDALYPGRQLPTFAWLRPVGIAGRADFAVGKDHRLIVSSAALTMLRRFCIDNCNIKTWSKKTGI